MSGSAESQVPKLIIREIIFEEFQRVWSQSTNVTDGRTDNLSRQYRAPLRFARYRNKSDNISETLKDRGKLEVHGRARREAARRRKSECQINFRKTKFLSQ